MSATTDFPAWRGLAVPARPDVARVVAATEHVRVAMQVVPLECAACGGKSAVPVLEWGTAETRGAPSAALQEMLHMFRDDDLGDVGAVVGLVHWVEMLGPRDVPHGLGHAAMVDRVAAYVGKHMCPWCDPAGFGTTRAYAGRVLTKGLLRFAAAAELLEATAEALGPVRGKAAAEALECVNDALFSARLGLRGAWFERWTANGSPP